MVTKRDSKFINSIELENYKLFTELTKVKLNKINLIFGKNSTGKSSILEAITLLKQSISSSSDPAVLTTKGEYEIPTIREIISDGDTSKELKISLVAGFSPLSIQKIFKWTNKNVLLDSIKIYSSDFKSNDKNLTAIYKFEKLKEDKHNNEFNFDTGFSSFMNYMRGGVAPPKHKPKMVGKLEYINFNTPLGKEISEFMNNDFKRLLAFSLIKMLKIHDHELENELCKMYGVPYHYFELTNHKEVLSKQLILSKSKSEFKKETNLRLAITKIPSIFESNILKVDEMKSLLKILSKDNNHEEFSEYIYENYKSKTIINAEGIMIAKDYLKETELSIIEAYNEWVSNISRMIRRNKIENEYKEKFKKILFINGLNDFITMSDQNAMEALDSFIPLSVQRPETQPIYIYSGSNPTDVGYKAQNVPDILYRMSDIRSSTDRWLKSLGLGFSLIIKRSVKSDFFEIRFRDKAVKNQKNSFSFKDIGTGMKSILPIIVNCNLLTNKTIAIQEPERSLHPEYQINLMDMFVETSKNLNNKYLIETHSELLILRLMKLVKEKKISHNDVSINYVSKSETGSKINNLKMNENGDFIDKWPDGFFIERLKI